MHDYREYHYESADGLRLFARDYPAQASSDRVILCLHGLTRNSADFESLAPRLASHSRVIVPDQRGRGRSAWDDTPANYQPLTYVQDMFRLLDALGLDSVTVIGTSMGGLMGLLMAAMQPWRVHGLVLNDVGPEVDPAGLARIRTYVGSGGPVADWSAAAAALASVHRDAFADYGREDWLRFARRTYRETPNGLVADYDPAIALPMQQTDTAAVPPDLWPVFDAITSKPILVIRGARSDILSTACVAEMQARKPDLHCATVAGRGHAPMLDEPEALAALATFLGAG